MDRTRSGRHPGVRRPLDGAAAGEDGSAAERGSARTGCDRKNVGLRCDRALHHQALAARA